jgi:tight adherence protein B
MKTSTLIAMLLVGGGLAAVVVGVLLRVQARQEQLSDILDLPFGERDVAIESVTESYNPLVAGTIGLAGKMVDRFDAKGSLRSKLERARIPMRPAEYVVVCASGGVILAALLDGVLGSWVFALFGFAAAFLLGRAIPTRRIAKRRKAFEAQLPEALTLIASSLSAGHTFLRSIQMMCEESEPPLSEEFSRVVAETRLGSPVVDALANMSERLQIRDVDWVVQAIRIQQTVGGKLADLLHTLADFIRARDDVRREVRVLTAEGRMSAWVLSALPVFLIGVIQVANPGYLDPMLHGWGIAVSAGTALMAAMGTLIIFRMVKIDV